MNINIKNILVFAWIPFVLSCQKKDNTPADLTKVTVQFASPTTSQTCHKGDVINVNANVTYNSEIIGIGVQIIDTATGSVVFDADHDLHTDHFSLSETWTDDLNDSAVLELRVTVFVANTKEKAERSIYFTSIP